MRRASMLASTLAVGVLLSVAAGAETPDGASHREAVDVAPMVVPGTVPGTSEELWRQVRAEHDAVIELVVTSRQLRAELRDLAETAISDDLARLHRRLAALDRQIEQAWKRASALVVSAGRRLGPVTTPPAAVGVTPRKVARPAVVARRDAAR